MSSSLSNSLNNNNSSSSFLQTRTLIEDRDMDVDAVVDDTNVDSSAGPIVSCDGIADGRLAISTLRRFICLAWVRAWSMVRWSEASACWETLIPARTRTDPHDPS